MSLLQAFPRGGGGGTAGVTSFNGRTGAVTPQSGDYGKGDVGLANVDNTADLDKPVSTATQTALNGKINSTEKGAANGVATLDSNGKVPTSQLPSSSAGVTSFNGRTGAVTPQNGDYTKSNVGLGNVDNTADLDKPISTATQTALNAKADNANVVHTTGDESIAGTKTFTGNVVCSNPLTVAGADYAEKFKTLENIPLYRFVTLDGEYAKLAQKNDYILGVTSNTPGILGNILVDEGIAVGLIGQLWVEQDGTAEVNDFVTSGVLGIATKAAAGYRVMAVKDNKCKILFR